MRKEDLSGFRGIGPLDPPLILKLMPAGQVGNDQSAAAFLDSLPQVEWFLADRATTLTGCDTAFQNSGIQARILGRKSRRKPVTYDKRRYKRRNRIAIMFGRLKDWRRAATRYDRFTQTYLSAVALAATVLFWL